MVTQLCVQEGSPRLDRWHWHRPHQTCRSTRSPTDYPAIQSCSLVAPVLLLSPHVHLQQLPSRPCGHLGPSGLSPAARGSLLCTSPITPPCEAPTAVDPTRPPGLEGLLPTHSSPQALPALAPSRPQAHPPLRVGGASLARAPRHTLPAPLASTLQPEAPALHPGAAPTR